MKKITIILTVLIAMTIKTNAQIPNYNFENWSNGANNPPDGWEDRGSDHTGFYPTTQTLDKYFGTYAVRIENKITATDTTEGNINTIRPSSVGGFGPAFPIATRYNNLKGFYKYAPLNGDSTQILVYITKTGLAGSWGDLLAYGQKQMGAAETYTPFSVGYLDSLNFMYMDSITIPDSGYINISAYKMIGDSTSELPPLGNSILYVDALNFDSYITGINEYLEITTNFKLFPNVNNGSFDVSFETLENEYTTIKIYDMQGREIMNLFSGSLSAGNHAFHYSLQELNNGNYLYVVASGKGYRAEKLIIQK
jgi:hypothetical protein